MSNKKDVVKKSSRLSTSSVSSSSSRRSESEKSSEKKIKKDELPVTKSTNKLSSRTTRSTKIIQNVSKASSKIDQKNDIARNSKESSSRTKLKVTDSPSTRVVKSQYFPSKTLYSNVIREKLKSSTNDTEMSHKKPTETPSKPRKRSKSRTLDPSEVKVLKSKQKQDEYSSDTSISLERPRTATLRKGSIVNMNIVGPDAPNQSKPKQMEDSYDYEDDFDSYESDFDEYHSSSPSTIADIASPSETFSTSEDSDTDLTSSQKRIGSADEERKLDSGNYELPEAKHKQMLDNIKESIEQENAALSNLTSLSDEGFEEGKSIQTGNAAFINFLDAQKKCIRRKSLAKKRKRGEELLSMIRLDNQSFTILDIPAIPYDDFIKIYGNQSTLQISTQTGEDNVFEEIQTDQIKTITKWTQFPISISKIDETDQNYLNFFKMECKGVGTDTIITNETKETNNLDELNTFLNSVEDVITQLIQGKNHDQMIVKNKKEIPFSDGYITFKLDEVLSLRNKIKTIEYVSFSHVSDVKFLTIHSASSTELEYKSVICVWNINNPNQPEKLLTTFGNLTCCNFAFDDTNVIFGGFYEGTIAVWNLWQSVEKSEEQTNFRRTNFLTEINSGHVVKVVSIQPFADNIDAIMHHASFQWKPSTQICSLDEDGVLIIWSVIIKGEDASKYKSVSLVQNSKMSLQETHPDLKCLKCNDLVINVLDLNHLFISTNYGYIIHYLASGAKPMPGRYTTDQIGSADCLVVCPFSPIYFLAGREDGNIVLYSRSIENGLKKLINIEENVVQTKIEMLQWSYCRPFVFYAKDNNNILHVWNLANSDMYPVYSIQFQEKINFIRLSPVNNKNTKTAQSYMMIVYENSEIELHILNSDHRQQSLESYTDDVQKFLNYVNRF